MTEPKPRSARGKGAFTLEAAREQILEKLAKAGAKGTASPFTVKTEPKRSLYSQALEELEAENTTYVDRTSTKPRYFEIQYAPNLTSARNEVLAIISAKGSEGTTSPIPAKLREPKRSFYSQALDAMESENAIYVDRGKAKPKYFSIEFKPSASAAAAKMEQLAARRHPVLVSAVDLKKALVANEKALATEAIALLENDRRLVKLTHGKSVLFAHGDSLRAVLGAVPQAGGPTESNSGETIREAYENLVRLTGFPDVEIASLQRQSGVPMAALKEWLLAEHESGRADFGTGDWSLAKDDTRAGLIDLRGERYLYVRLRVSP